MITKSTVPSNVKARNLSRKHQRAISTFMAVPSPMQLQLQSRIGLFPSEDNLLLMENGSRSDERYCCTANDEIEAGNTRQRTRRQSAVVTEVVERRELTRARDQVCGGKCEGEELE